MSEQSAQKRPHRAADDFAAISHPVRQLQAQRGLRSSDPAGPVPASRELAGGVDDPNGFDFICDQPVPEDYGIIDAGGGHIAIRRRDGGRHG